MLELKAIAAALAVLLAWLRLERWNCSRAWVSTTEWRERMRRLDIGGK